MDAIAAGSIDEVSMLTRAHILNAQQLPLEVEWDAPIDALAVRRQVHAAPFRTPRRPGGTGGRP